MQNTTLYLHGDVNISPLHNNHNNIQGKEPSLADIFAKLTTLDRIELKIYNVNSRMEAIEEHVSALENDSDHCTGNLDGHRVDLQTVQKRQLTENNTDNSAI